MTFELFKRNRGRDKSAPTRTAATAPDGKFMPGSGAEAAGGDREAGPDGASAAAEPKEAPAESRPVVTYMTHSRESFWK